MRAVVPSIQPWGILLTLSNDRVLPDKVHNITCTVQNSNLVTVLRSNCT